MSKQEELGKYLTSKQVSRLSSLCMLYTDTQLSSAFDDAEQLLANALHHAIFVYAEKLGLGFSVNPTYYDKPSFIHRESGFWFRIDGLTGKIIEE